jgi:glycosyltransferase involved in cell wall biosynthesis
MRILYHHRTLGDGAEGIHIAEIVNSFRKIGHDVFVVSLIGDSTNIQSNKQKMWSKIAKSMPDFFYEIGEITYNISSYISIYQAIKEFRPHFIYDRYAIYHYSAVALANRFDIPIVLEVNCPYSNQKEIFDETLYFKRLSRFFERRICYDATHVIVVSTPLKKFLVSIGVPPKQIVVIPNGTDPEIFHPDISGKEYRCRYGLDGKVVIGFTGILRPWHGLDLLLRAFEQVSYEYSRLHLLIVGDGPARADLERWLVSKDLSRQVTITGRQPYNRISQFVAAMDIAVSPRATFYASPMKILEYMAMGKAIVAPDMENIRDILHHRQDAILFPPEDVEGLVGGLRELIRDPVLRASLGHEARRRIETERTWLHNVQRVIQLVENAAGVALDCKEVGHGVF